MLVDVEAEHLAEERRVALAVPVRIAGGAAVTEADVQLAVRPEDDVAAVVVRVGLFDEQQLALGRGIGVIGIVGACRELDDARVALRIGEVHVDASRVCEVGVEREAEEPLLRPPGDATAEVEKRRRRGLQPPVDDDAHESLLLDDEQPPLRIAWRERERDRLIQPVEHLRERHPPRDVGGDRRRRWRRGPGRTTRAAGERRHRGEGDSSERRDDPGGVALRRRGPLASCIRRPAAA